MFTPKIMTVVRMLAIAWSIILLLVIAIGSFSKENIGAMTWGPTSDIWAITVAMSNLEYGLGGHLGYKEVEQSLANRLTSKKNSLDVNDDETRKIVSDPKIITAAIRAATSLDKNTFVKPVRAEDGGYTVLAAEDTGLSDYYRWAFELFGFNAYSTRNLYLAILAGSFFLFIVAYAECNTATSVITLFVTALFLETTSGIFSPLLPSLSANRFLSTLAIIPFFHLMCGILGTVKITRLRTILLLIQSILLASLLSVRSSASWTLIALCLISASTIFLNTRLMPQARPASLTAWKLFFGLYIRAVLCLRLPSVFLRALGRISIINLQVIFIILIVAGSTMGVAINDRLKTNRIYFTDELIGHHLIWHNPYIALALHPDWPAVKPYPDQPDIMSDNVSWVAYSHTVAKMGISIGSPIFIIRYGLLDRIIRGELLTFIANHPRFTLELYFYYKVKRYIETLTSLVATIPFLDWIPAIVSILLTSVLLSSRPPRIQILKLFVAVLIAWTSALAPTFWAYSAPHVFTDQLLTGLFLLLYLLPQFFSLLCPFAMSARARQQEKIKADSLKRLSSSENRRA